MSLVRDVMVREVIDIDSAKTAKDVAQLLKEKDISFLIVTENQKPIGIVTERDLVRKVVITDKKSSEVPLSDIMSYKFRSVEPYTAIEDAVQKMVNLDIRRLVVMEGDNVVGVITQRDLVKHLRNRLLIEGAVDKFTKEDEHKEG